MATFNVAPPENFDFMNPVEFDKWLTRFERFKSASGLNEKSQETQVNTLVYCMGKQADDVFQSFSLSADQMKNYDTVKNKFKSHFVIRKNTIFERAKFNSRRQEDGESADSFITALYTLSEHCKYAALREELIRDRLVVGIRDEKLSQKLQLDPDLTLEKAINMVRQNEAVRQQQAIIRGSSEGIDAVRSSRNSGLSRRRQRGGKRSQIQTQSSRCGRCGATPGHNRTSCPAADSLCHGCKQKGHWLRMCRNEQTDVSCVNALVHNDNDSDSYEDDNYYLGCVDEDSSRPWYVELQKLETSRNYFNDLSRKRQNETKQVNRNKYTNKMRWKYDSEDSRAFKCCFCCHVRVGTVILGLWHLIVHVFVIGCLIMSSLHPELLRDGMEPGTSMESDGILVVDNKSASGDSFGDFQIKYETPSVYRSPFEKRMRKEDMCLAFALILCTFLIALMLVYGAIKSRPGYLIPFFCLQVFDFCLNCLTVVGYMSYAPNVKLWIVEQGLERYPIMERLINMDEDRLMMLFVIVFVLILSIKAYLIDMVWSCYKYLNLRNANRSVVREYTLDPDSEMLLPPKYEEAVKMKQNEPSPPPYTA